MSLDLTSPTLRFALATVRQAARLAARIRADLAMTKLTKADLSPVTVADFAIQAVAARALEQAFPGDPLVAEERSSELSASEVMLDAVTRYAREAAQDATEDAVCRWLDRGQADAGSRFWTLDPIDGTKGYLRGGQYAVALALVVEGRVELGVLGCPSLPETCSPDTTGSGVILAAQRGQGAWSAPLEDPERFAPLRVSSRQDPRQARLMRSYESGHTNIGEIDEFVRVMGIQAEPVRMDSQAKYAVLCAGHGDLILRLLSPDARDYREKIWDHAAGVLAVEEAGGRVTDLEGRPLDFRTGRTLERNRGVVASNGWLHDAALDALAQIKNG